MSENKRINYVITGNGRRGSGKTTWIFKLIEMYKKRGMKVLIVDTYDHPSYKDVPVLQPDQLKHWKKGVYRMFGSDFDTMLKAIDTYLYNALIVFEDAYKYQERKLDPNVKRFVIDSKGKNLDIIFLYHAWGWIPPDLLRISDYLEVFKTNDSPETRKNYITGYYPEAMRIYTEVMADASPYAHKSISIRA